MQTEQRSFIVHLEDDQRHCRRLEGDSFEAAAFTFAADLHSQDDEVVLIVTDESDGRRQCFRLDLHSGAANPCA